MASFNTIGIEGLELSLEEVANLPEEVLLEMLTSEGEVIKRAQVRKLQELALVDSHQLVESISVDKRLRSNGRYPGSTMRYILVYPKGVRKKADGSAQTTRYRYKKKRAGKTASVHDATNGEVGFINEFGAPRRGIGPTQWMRRANEGAHSEAVEAAMQVYDAWLRAKGL